MNTREKLDALHGLDQQIKALQHKRARLAAEIDRDIEAQRKDRDSVSVEIQP